MRKKSLFSISFILKCFLLTIIAFTTISCEKEVKYDTYQCVSYIDSVKTTDDDVISNHLTDYDYYNLVLYEDKNFNLVYRYKGQEEAIAKGTYVKNGKEITLRYDNYLEENFGKNPTYTLENDTLTRNQFIVVDDYRFTRSQAFTKK